MARRPVGNCARAGSKSQEDFVSNWKRFLPWPVAALIFVGVMTLAMRAQDKPPASEPPTIESLQKAIAEKDSQIASLTQRIAQIQGDFAALNKLHSACFSMLSADEAQVADDVAKFRSYEARLSKK
jgi:hypothetical protein